MIELQAYGADAEFVVLDWGGACVGFPSDEDLVEFCERASVRGDAEHTIGVRWTDEHENDVSVRLTRDEVRAVLEARS